MRTSQDVLELWEKYVETAINKFGDEKWLVYEQVYMAALDCHNIGIATDCIAALRAQFPHSVRVQKLIAMRHEAAGNFDTAQRIYQDILEDDETNALVRKRLISCLKSQNKPREYITELIEYLKFFQADHEAWLELSDAYLNEMEFSKAAFCLEELLLMNPHNHCYHQRFADIKYTLGQYETAKSYYAYSLRLNPNNIRALYGLMLVTANLKSGGKLGQKEAAENAKLNSWAREQIEIKYKEKKSDKPIADSLSSLLQNLSIAK